MAERGMPPPSSEILIVMSSLPAATMTLIGGYSSASVPWVSMVARSEFLRISKSMWF
jgi:hypothetical protein